MTEESKVKTALDLRPDEIREGKTDAAERGSIEGAERRKAEILRRKAEGSLTAWFFHKSMMRFGLGQWIEDNDITPDTLPPEGVIIL